MHVPPETREGAGKAGCRPHPRSGCNKKHPVEPQVGRTSGLPCAMVLRLIRALPGAPGFLATITARSKASSRQRQRACARCAGYQRRGIGTTRLRRPRRLTLVWRKPSRPSQPALAYRDDAYAPLHEAGWRDTNTISEKKKEKYFRRSSWTDVSALKPLVNFAVWRRQLSVLTSAWSW
jgi:hypothetical protein